MAQGKLPARFNGYRVDRSYTVDHQAWNAAIPDLHDRVTALESVEDYKSDLYAKGVEEVIRRVDTAVTPIIDQITADAEAAREQLEQILNTGIPADRIQETAQRVFLTPAQRSVVDGVPQQIAAAIAASNRVSVRAYWVSSF